jgi:hypothetical protein
LLIAKRLSYCFVVGRSKVVSFCYSNSFKEKEINFNCEETVLALRDVSTRGVSTARLSIVFAIAICCY